MLEPGSRSLGSEPFGAGELKLMHY